MNKTVNINLAGTFFHIDEDAYVKLQRYLEAIKRSFTDSQGRAEILADIEARIAELFNERVHSERQVIRIIEVDDVIAIMGQPEDYLVDDEIFEDEPHTAYSSKNSESKKLFRDTENSYIGGVSSGLGHYLGIDTIWIRLVWTILFFGFGTGLFIYIILWILVPEAKTTAEKIMMMGEPVNISNIEKKIKDGFETVSETVSGVAKNVSDAAKNVDFKKQSNTIKSSSKTFFDTIADVIMFFFKVFAKFIGIILIFVGASALIALIIGSLSVGVVDTIHIPGLDLAHVVNAGNTPVWVALLLGFLVVGIPFFFLFYLGLKILVNNLKSIGNIAKYTLFGLWIFSIIGIIVISIREASEHAFTEHVIEKQQLPYKVNDTLVVKMAENDVFNNFYRRGNSFKLVTNDAGEKIIYSSDIEITIKPTTDSVASISIEKNADGSSFEKAIERAKNINYNYSFKANKLNLDAYFSTHSNNKFSDQNIDIVLYLPQGSFVKFDDNTTQYLGYGIPQNYTKQVLKITEDGATCEGCVIDNFEVNMDTPNVIINDDGIEIKSNNNVLKIDSTGIKATSKSVKVDINSKGVNIKSEN